MPPTTSSKHSDACLDCAEDETYSVPQILLELRRIHASLKGDPATADLAATAKRLFTAVQDRRLLALEVSRELEARQAGFGSAPSTISRSVMVH